MAGYEDFAEEVSPAADPYASFAEDAAPAIKPGDVEARKQQLGVQGDVSSGFRTPEQTPQAKSLLGKVIGAPKGREELTVPGEFTGGLKDIYRSISNIANKPIEPPTLGNVLMGTVFPKEVADVSQGAIRTAASPAAPVFNLATRGGDIVDTLASNIPGSSKPIPGLSSLYGQNISLRDVLAGIAAGIGDYILPNKAAEGTGLLKEAMRKKLPLKGERVAAAEEGFIAKEAAVTKEAEDALANSAARKSSEESIARARHQAEAAPLQEGEARIRTSAQGAATPEALGKQFIEKTFPEKQAASRAEFNERYGKAIEEGKAIPTSGAEVAAQAEKTLAEKGVAGTPGATKGEKSAEMLKEALDVEDVTATKVRAQLSVQGFEQMPADMQQQLLKKAGIDITPAREGVTNLGDLVLERQRLKGAARGAYQSGNFNTARQLDDLAKSTMKEIETVNKDFAKKIAAIDADYAVKHAPFFGAKATTRQAASRSAETVLDRFIPPKGAPNRVEQAERARQLVDNPDQITRSFLNQGVSEAEKAQAGFAKGYVKWWDKYADSKTGDKVLKTWLGDDYKHHKDIVDRFRIAKPKTAEKAFSDTIAEIDKQSQKRGQFALKNRDDAIEQLRSQTAHQIKEITGEKMDPKRIKNYGMFLLIEGAVSGIIGSPTGAYRAIVGGLMVMTPNAVAKMINIPGGAQLVRRGLRAVPGTEQAAATARQIQNFLASHPSDTEGTSQQ